MKQGPRYHVKPRRRREGKTDYRRRLSLLKSRKTRMVVRKSLKNTQVQFIEYKEGGDNVVATANSKELVNKYNWNTSTSNTSAAYLTGLLAGKRAKDKGIKECVLDIGRYVPVNGSRVFASLKGALDAGIDCPHDESSLPPEERLDKTVNDIKSKIIGGK